MKSAPQIDKGALVFNLRRIYVKSSTETMVQGSKSAPTFSAIIFLSVTTYYYATACYSEKAAQRLSVKGRD